MLWYNNPQAVSAMHREMMRHRRADVERRSMLRLAGAGDVDERH